MDNILQMDLLLGLRNLYTVSETFLDVTVQVKWPFSIWILGSSGVSQMQKEQ